MALTSTSPSRAANLYRSPYLWGREGFLLLFWWLVSFCFYTFLTVSGSLSFFWELESLLVHPQWFKGFALYERRVWGTQGISLRFPAMPLIFLLWTQQKKSLMLVCPKNSKLSIEPNLVLRILYHLPFLNVCFYGSFLFLLCSANGIALHAWKRPVTLCIFHLVALGSQVHLNSGKIMIL